MLSDPAYVRNLEAEGLNTEPGTAESVGANTSRIVCMPLLAGVLNQAKYLMLKVCPITIELELHSDATQSLRDEG
eukprot:4441757-Amphidinium_carterae.1